MENTREPDEPKMGARVTVGILSWNRKDALRIALESVRRQSIFAETEVLVVDNCSLDGTREMLRVEFPWVRLVERETNSGLAEGRNILVRLARAPIVFWMDDDCELVEDDCLEKLVRELELHPEVAVVFGRILEGDNGSVHLLVPQDSKVEKLHRMVGFPESFASGGMCVRNPQFLHLGGYDRDLFRMRVEQNFSYKVFDAGLFIEYYPRVSIIHRPHSFGRNYRVITYYYTRNCLLSLWRYTPYPVAICTSVFEIISGFLWSLRGPARMLGFCQGLAEMVLRLPGCLLKERRPMGPVGFSHWAHCRHYFIRSLDECRRLPARYPFVRFAVMELKLRVLSHLGWSREHPFFTELAEGGTVNTAGDSTTTTVANRPYQNSLHHPDEGGHCRV
jgi:GT2 family glycosyltransferase